ncbi:MULTISPECIES: LuxR C-terminal-related transcriptional regulator [Bacteria]|uniref:response regulator transcription factor n=1 Tax=Bacteria TaxID=2 RepID=UPI003C7BC1EF
MASAEVQEVIVVSHDALVASALSAILAAEPGLRISASTSVAETASTASGETHAVVVYDVGSDEPEPADLAALVAACQMSRLIAVASSASFAQVAILLGAGVRGIVGRNAGAEELGRAVAEVSVGHVFISRLMLREIVEHIARCPSRADAGRLAGDGLLAPRERDVVRLLLRGMTNREIAGVLHLSEATVKAHLGRVMAKWQVRDRLQVALYALGLTGAEERRSG